MNECNGDVTTATALSLATVFKLFTVAYMSFRPLCDFVKPYPHILFGLGGIQWACALVLLYDARDVARWLRRIVANAPS